MTTLDWWPPDKCDYGQCPCLLGANLVSTICIWGNENTSLRIVTRPDVVNANRILHSYVRLQEQIIRSRERAFCSSRVSAKVEVKQYAQDMKKLKRVVEKLYQDEKTQPKVLGGPTGFYDERWFTEILLHSGF
ncbi:unnamed protein product [Arabidopsis halleri]